MTITSIGDLARSFHLRQQNTQAKSDLTRLTQELASGQVSDLGKALRGDFSALSSIERSLRLIDAYRHSTAEAALLTSGAQSALETLRTEIDVIAPTLLAATGGGAMHQMEIVADSASDRLSSAIAALNQDIAGRSIFSGTATDTAPLISADEMLVHLAPLAAGAADANDLIAAIDSWFMDSGGGFETVAYQGNSAQPPGFTVGEGETISNPLSALDPALRRALKGMALAALVAQGQGPVGDADRKQLLEHAALQMIEGGEGVTRLQARLGDVEARIETSKVRNETTRSVFEQERNGLTGIEPYAVATQLQEAQTRLESLYLLTTRLSRLSLTEYLR